MPVNLYEQALIHRCCDGDRAAYRELYEAFAGELLAIAMRYMKSKQEAEDVLQEAFIKAFKNLASFNQQAALKTWLTRIVINTALNALRKSHLQYETDQVTIDMAEPVQLPLEEFQFMELLSFIQQLPTGCKTIFNLYALEGYTHREIAALLNISEGTSKSQYARAKGLLQEIIGTETKKVKDKVV